MSTPFVPVISPNLPTDEASPAGVARYEYVVKAIREKIYRYELNPGDWIDEQRLAAELGVSRTPLREGLKLLAAEGLITVRPRRGSYVTKLTDTDIDQLFELMALLEGCCARKACAALSQEALQRLRVLHDELEVHAAAQDIGRYHEKNIEVHTEIQQLSGNRWLASMSAELRKVIRLARLQTARYPDRLAQSLQEHRDLMRAFEARDPDAAEAVMRGHLMNQLAVLRKMRASF